MKKITLAFALFCACASFAQTPVAPPYTNDFNDAAGFTGIWTFQNPATVGEWVYSSDYFGIEGSGSVVFLPDANNPSHNWLFSAPFTLTAVVNYALDFKYINLSAGFDAHLKVMIGSQNDSCSMTTQIVNIGAYDLNQTNYDLCALSHTVFSVPTTGTYYIGFLDAGSVAPGMDGGQSIDEFSITPASSTSIQDSHSGLAQISPNPTSEWMNVVLPQPNAKVMIYDVAGQLVMDFPVASGQARINISSLPKGMYIVKMYAGNEIFTQKINKY
jgi:hypothetical protein